MQFFLSIWITERFLSEKASNELESITIDRRYRKHMLLKKQSLKEAKRIALLLEQRNIHKRSRTNLSTNKDSKRFDNRKIPRRKKRDNEAEEQEHDKKVDTVTFHANVPPINIDEYIKLQSENLDVSLPKTVVPCHCKRHSRASTCVHVTILKGLYFNKLRESNKTSHCSMEKDTMLQVSLN